MKLLLKWPGYGLPLDKEMFFPTLKTIYTRGNDIMSLNLMWGFEIGAAVEYYRNSGWKVPPQTNVSGTDYALYDTQFYESHQPITKIGGGLRCLKQTSYLQWDETVLTSPEIFSLKGTYSEISTPPAGAFQSGMIHFSFKHDFDFDFDITGMNFPNGKWIHLCTLTSASQFDDLVPFKDGCLISDAANSDYWMPLPATAPCWTQFQGKGWKAHLAHVGLYLVRQEVVGTTPGTGGPCANIGDFLVAIGWEQDESATCSPTSQSRPTSVMSASVDLTPDVWTKFAIKYNATGPAPGSHLQVWQDGILIMDEGNIRSSPSKWSSVTFSPHGRYVLQNGSTWPAGGWPEYSHLIDHLFVWGDPNETELDQATASLFIQGLYPVSDNYKGTFLNDQSTDVDLWDYIKDPGDPTPMEINFCHAVTNPSTACSFDVKNPANVENGALSWGDFTPFVDQYVGVGTIAACTKDPSSAVVGYRGSAIVTQNAVDEVGVNTIINSGTLVWHSSTQQIDGGGDWTIGAIDNTKAGFKIEPE